MTREDHPLYQSIQAMKTAGTYKLTPIVMTKHMYDELDLWFVELCEHHGNQVCSVCKGM